MYGNQCTEHSDIKEIILKMACFLQGYGFVEFLSEEDADYSIKIMNMIKLYGKPIRVNKASAHQKNLDVGANIFIGNLDPEVDEKLLYDTFSAFGVILTTPKVRNMKLYRNQCNVYCS